MKKNLRQQALKKALELLSREIQRTAASAQAASQGFIFGIRAKTKRDKMIEYREELERMLDETINK